MRALYLHKRDFRFFDNEVLHWLDENQVEFVAAYVWEPSLMSSYELADRHQFAVTQALDFLKERYQKQEVSLIECYGEMLACLDRLHNRLRFDVLVSHMEHGTEATYARDRSIKSWCQSKGILWKEFESCTVKRGLKDRDERIKIWNTYMAERLRPVPQRLVGQEVPAELKSQFASPVQTLRQHLEQKHCALDFHQRFQTIDEKSAHETLQDFLNERSIKYRGGISSPNTALSAGSRLSAHLAWGTLSIRCVYRTTKQKMFELQHPLPNGDPTALQRRHFLSLKSFSARLHWRDHFIQRLEDQPDMPSHALNSAFEHIPFSDDKDRLEAWLFGKTGEPIVDACMRCLQTTGFVNFRMRSMCISYAVYALHLDWRLVGRALAEIFYDYEPGIHWSQVQMQAGVVGINTIRVYSPEKQLLDQDPDCKFVKTWIPELAHYSADEIKCYNTLLGDLSPYPSPIVCFKEQSSQMKKIIYGIKNGPENRAAKPEVLKRHGSRMFRKTKRA